MICTDFELVLEETIELKESKPEKKESEIFISSQEKNKLLFLSFYWVFVATTGQKVDQEGFINGLAFALSMTPPEDKNDA